MARLTQDDRATLRQAADHARNIGEYRTAAGLEEMSSRGILDLTDVATIRQAGHDLTSAGEHKTGPAVVELADRLKH